MSEKVINDAIRIIITLLLLTLLTSVATGCEGHTSEVVVEKPPQTNVDSDDDRDAGPDMGEAYEEEEFSVYEYTAEEKLLLSGRAQR